MEAYMIILYKSVYRNKHLPLMDSTSSKQVSRGAVWSGSTLFAIPSASFGLISLWQSHIVQILEWLQQIFWVYEYLGSLRYAATMLLTNTADTLHYDRWNEPQHDKTNNVAVCPVKTQISLSIRPVWSESSLSAWRKLGSLAIHWAHSKDSDQTGRMPRPIWVFAGRTVTLLVLSCGGSNQHYAALQYMLQSCCWYEGHPISNANISVTLTWMQISPFNFTSLCAYMCSINKLQQQMKIL